MQPNELICCIGYVKAVTRNLFPGCILPLLSFPSFPFVMSLLFSFPFPLSYPSPRSGPLNPARGLGSAVSSPNGFQGGVPAADAFYAFRAQETRLVAANVVLFLLNKIRKMKQMCFFFWIIRDNL